MTTTTADAAMASASTEALKARAPLEGAVHIPLALLAPSPTNPRKHFDAERIRQIADSLRAVGQIQPIRARPNPAHTPGNGRPAFEIVVGETRWRAAHLAGLPTIDAVVRHYTDLEVLEIQLVENLQRSDLHPMEEAQGYEQLLRKPNGLQGYATVADLAARVGKSPSYVYQRIKLLALCPAGREAFHAGKLSPSVALLIARMPDQAEQAKATATIAAGWGGEPYSYRTAAELLQREYMLALAKAPFDLLATYGVAGPCADCPKRSGAAPDLFADVTSGDMCQDARCYQAKAEEAKQARLVVDQQQQAQHMAEALRRPAAPPAADAPATTSATTGRVVFTPAPKPTPPAGVSATGRGARTGGKGAPEDDRAAQAAATEKRHTIARFEALLFEQAVAAIRSSPLNIEALRLACLDAFDRLSYEGIALLYPGFGWPEPDRVGINPFDADFKPRVAEADSYLLSELLTAMPLAEALSNGRLTPEHLAGKVHEWDDGPQIGALLASYGVDAAACWQQAAQTVRAQLAALAAAAPALAHKPKPISQTMTDAFISQHGAGAAADAPTAAPTKPGNKAPIKYRCRLTGSTWSGRGLQPAWLKAALARGAKLSDFDTTTQPAAAGVDQTDEGDSDATN